MADTVADVIARALSRHGIEHIYGQSNPTALMLAAERIGIRQVFYRTENAGGAMSDGYSRISNRIGVIAAQNGPAATLLVAPMAEALKASMPLLCLVQEVPAAKRDRNAFQELDHAALFHGVAKWVRTVESPSRAEDYIDLAITMANSGRPGPVVLMLPSDVLRASAEPGLFNRTRSLGAFPLDRPRPERTAVREAARLLAAAKSPLIVAGGGIHGSGAVEALERLQQVSMIPATTTNMGKGAVCETSPLSIGVSANVTGKLGPAHHMLELIEGADVVLLVGTRTNENGTNGWSLTPADATYIHIDMDPLEVGRSYESVRLVGDARSALEDLAEAMSELDLTKRRDTRPEVESLIERGRTLAREAQAKLNTTNSTPIAPQRLLAELDAILRPDDIVVADASYASIWVTSHLTAKKAGQRFLVPRGLAGLGWGVPLALGAKMARPNARVFAIVGDGGFAHVWGEIETAMRENLPITIIVLNNSILAYQRHAENFMFGRTTTAIGFADVNHAAVAQAAGAHGQVVSDPADIASALIAAIESGKPAVLDVVVDPDAYAPVRAWDLKADVINAT